MGKARGTWTDSGSSETVLANHSSSLAFSFPICIVRPIKLGILTFKVLIQR
jgi:hypothetical protein